jgi:RHS repeat-associated protein
MAVLLVSALLLGAFGIPSATAGRDDRTASGEPRTARAGERAAAKPSGRAPVARMRAGTSRAARERRARSRRQHRGLTANVARRRARSLFGSVAAGPLWRPVPLTKGQRVERYLDPYTAVVGGGDAAASVVRNDLPLRARDASGRLAPVDLALVDAGNGLLRAANPLVESQVGVAVGTGLRLPEIDTAIVPEVADPEVRTQLAGGRAFYANVDTDTDFLVRAIPGGLQTFSQLRSPASPEQLALRVAAPAGSRLREAPEGPGGYQLVRGERILAHVGPPAAIDADGRAVPVTSRVDGDVLRIRVAHRDQPVTYPVMVDPTFVEDTYQWKDEASPDFGLWKPETNNTAKFLAYAGDSYLGKGLYVYNRTTQAYATTDYGRYALDVRGYGDAYIFAATFNQLYHDGLFAETFLDTGIYDRRNNRWASGDRDPATNVWTPNKPQTSQEGFYDYRAHPRACVNSTCARGGVTPGNAAFMQTRVTSAGNRSSFTDFMGGAAVSQADDVKPVLSSATVPAGWVKSAPAMSATFTDTGLGMHRTAVAVTPARSWTHTAGQPATAEKATTACADTDPDATRDTSGKRQNPCPKDLGVTFGSGDLPDGPHTLKLTGTDVLGDVTADSRTLKLDTAGPSIALSGPVATNRFVAPGATLRAVATDGTATAPRSGASRIEIFVDDVRQGAPQAQPCAAGSCSVTRDFTLTAPHGEHTIVVKAYDQLGNETVHPAFTVFVDGRDPAMTLTGTLKDNDGKVVTGPSYRLQADVLDGTAATPESGATFLQFTVDGVDRVAKTQACPAGSCTLSDAIDFLSANYADGEHSVKVTARDGVGNSAVQTVRVVLDRELPVIVSTTHAGLPTGWNDGSARPTAAIEARDSGAGVRRLRLYQPGAATQTRDFPSTAAPCDGTVASPCPRTGAAHTFSYSAAEGAEGRNVLRATAEDGAGRESEPDSTWTMRVDRSAPVLTLTGSLKNAANTVLVESAYDLTAAGADGSRTSAASERSGMKSIEILTRFEDPAVLAASRTFGRRDFIAQTCSAGSCALTRNWVFRSREYRAGEHTVRVVATDQLGRESFEELKVTVGPGLAEPDDRMGLEDFYHYESIETGAGSRAHVNLTTGNLVWHSTPLINPGRGLSTVVNVTYNAQRRTEQAVKPYDEAGTNVSVGISGLTRLNEPLDVSRAAVGGPIFLTDPDGSRHQFTARAPTVASGVGEVYIPPAGVNLHLRRYSSGLIDVGPVDEPDRTWAATRPDGVTFFFDGAGYQTSIEDRNGNVMRFDYEYRSATGALCEVTGTPLPGTDTTCKRKLVRVVDPVGVDDAAKAAARSVRLEYLPAGPEDTGTSPSGRLASVTDHAGRVLRFEYVDGYLRKYVQASGSPVARSFALDYEAADDPDRGGATDLEPRYLKTVTDPRGGVSHVEYEPRSATGAAPTDTFSSRRVESIRDRRDARTRSADLRDPVDRGVQFWFGAEDEDGVRTTRAEVADGRSTCKLADPSAPRSGTCNVTKHTTDAFGRPIDTTDARAAKTVMEWDGDNNLKRLDVAVGTADRAETLMGYNTNGQLLAQTDPMGRRTELTYRDGPGTLRSPRGNDDAETSVSDLTELTTPKGTETAAEDDFATKFEPDPKGNVRAEVDAEGHRAETDFDARGQILAERDQMRNATTYSCHDANGMPQVVTNPRTPGGAGSDAANDGRWVYTYDAVGNTVAVTDPRGAGTAACPGKGTAYTSTLTYDALDRLRVERLPKLSAANVFVERTYTYDGNDNLSESKDAVGAVRSALFNAMDDPEQLRTPAVPHAGETSDAMEIRKRTYDGDENLLTEDRPKGSATAEASDYSTLFRYDALSQRIAETDRTRGDVDGDGVRDDEDLTTAWAYDLRGNVSASADPKSLQDCKTTDPVAGVNGQALCRRWSYVYDRSDNVLKETERPGSLNYTTERTYDANDNVKTEVDPRGTKTATPTDDFTTTFLYDARDLDVGRTDAKGNRTAIELRPDGKPRADVTARGTATAQAGDFETRYEYYATGELLSQSLPAAPGQYGPLGRKAVWQRNAVGDATTITDPRGRSFTNTYLDSGELRTTTRPSAFSLDPSDGIQERDVTDMGSRDAKPDLPSSEGEGDFGKVDPEPLPEWLPKAGKVDIGYDDEMRVTSVAEVGAPETPTARMTRDALGRVVESSQPLDVSPAGTTSDRYVVNRFAFDRNGNAQRTVDGEDQMSEVLHDQFDRPHRQDAPGSAGREVTLLRYDRNGNVAARQTPRGPAFTWTFAYDGIDRMTSSKNPAGDETTFDHDEVGNVKLERSPRGNELPVGHADRPRFEQRSSYSPINELTEKRDGLGHVATYGYDRDGNQDLAVEPGAKADAAAPAEPKVTRREFDGRGLLWAETTGSKADGTRTPHTRTTVTEHDPVGNLVRTVTPMGVDEATRRPTVAWDGGAVTTTSTATRHATVHEYSDDNVLAATHMPYGERDDQDRIRHRQDFVLDERGRIKSIDSAYPWADPNAKKSRTTYTYYDTGWVRSTTDPVLVNSTTQEPLKDHVIDYEYDRRGNQTRYLVRDGRRVERSFFPNGLLRQRQVRKGDGPATRLYDYTYNENRSRKSMYDKELDRTTNFERDPAERETLTNETWTGGKDTRLGHDRDGNVAKRETDGKLGAPKADGSRDYVGGKTATFVFDAIGRETSMTVNAANEPARTTGTDYFPSGEVANRTDPNGVVESKFFTSDGQQVKLKRQKPGQAANKDSTYTYDRNGNRATDERGAHAYNSRDQLVQWQRPANPDGTAGKRVTFDVNGSGAVTRKDDGGAVTTYVQNGDRLEDVQGAEGPSHYDYDDFGNVKAITGAEAATFTYDDFARMTKAESSGETNSYTYDGLDRRDSRTKTTPTTAAKKADFSYIGSSENLSQEKDPNDAQANEVWRSYDYDSQGERVGMSMKNGASAPTSARYSKDVNGSVEDLEDGTGTKKAGAHYDYDPYGKLLNENQIADAGAKANPFRFEGFYYDSGVKSYDMRARLYKPDVGRFLAQDRFESARGDLNLQSDPLTQNRYAFAGGNPVNRIEFDGHFGLSDVKKGFKKAAKGAFEAGKYVVGDNPLEIGITVLSVAAAIPTGGTSLAVGAAAKTAAKTAVKTAAKKATQKKSTQQAAKSPGCKANSFVAGTPILLADGTSTPIEQIRVGDRVLATHPDTGLTGAFPVTALIVGQGSKQLVAVTVAGQTTVATARHPYWLPASGRWVDAVDLRIGDVLRRPDGTSAMVEHVRPFTVAGARVHNLTVGGAHTYYAGGDPVLVHNCGSTPNSGVYKFNEASGKEYVGQSSNIDRRLRRHVKNGKVSQKEADGAKRTEVKGDKFDREIEEQRQLDQAGGVNKTGNKVNPVGPKRQQAARARVAQRQQAARAKQQAAQSARSERAAPPRSSGSSSSRSSSGSGSRSGGGSSGGDSGAGSGTAPGGNGQSRPT